MSRMPCSSTLVRSFKALQWTTAESFQPRALINAHACPPQLSSSHVDQRALISSTGARTSTDRSCRAHSFVWCAAVNSRAVPIKLESKSLEYNFEGILITLVCYTCITICSLYEYSRQVVTTATYRYFYLTTFIRDL